VLPSAQNGLDEQISWMSPRGFHVKAKPNQELAMCIKPWDATQRKWFSVFTLYRDEN
jgi:hypothetical protein